MKIAQITYGAYDSSAVTRLSRALNKCGVQSDLIAVKLGAGVSGTCVQASQIHRAMNHAKWISENKAVNRKYQKTPMLFDVSDFGVMTDIQIKKLSEYDVLHMHYINGMISYRQMQQLTDLHKPMFWTMHDCWAFTGGCHYMAFGCDKYKDRCTACPVLNSGFDDISTACQRKKIESYPNTINIISPSKWMNERVKQSRIFGKNPSDQIYNGVDLNVFHGKEDCEKNQNNRKVILIGADSPVASPYKGYSHIVNALKGLRDAHPGLSEKIELVFFGGGCDPERLKKDFDGYQIKLKGFVTRQEDVAKLYREADVFLTASLYDNLPTTLIESLASGTPCVGYKTGGIPEIVDHQVNGYLAEREDDIGLAKGLLWVLENNKENVLGRQGREKAEKCFNDMDSAKNHIRLYHERLGM